MAQSFVLELRKLGLTRATKFVPVGTSTAAFIAAFGIKWAVIEGSTGGGLAQLRASKAAGKAREGEEGKA